MKSVNNKVRNVVTVFLIIALMVLSKYSFASTGKKEAKKENNVEVKHVGSIKGQDVIQVSIDNAQGESIEIVFVDAEGVELYAEVFNDKFISKKYLLDIPESNINNLELIVRTKKQSTTQSFKLAKDIKILEQTIIVKQ